MTEPEEEILYKIKFPIHNEKLETIDQITGFPKPISCSFQLETLPVSSTSESFVEFWTRVINGLPLPDEEKTCIPKLIPLKSKKKITSDKALKQVYLYELDVTDETRLAYNPADIIGIMPQNPSGLVEAVLKRLLVDNIHARVKIVSSTIPTPSTTNGLYRLFMERKIEPSYFEIFTYLLNLNAFPKKVFLRTLGDVCTNLKEKKYLYYLSSKQGSEDYLALKRYNLNLLDWLEGFPSAKPTVSILFELLGPLIPREYSIASSPLSKNKTIKFCFNTFEVFSDQSPEAQSSKGICSGWLESLYSSIDDISHLPILWKIKETTLKLPDVLNKPFIFIATGTGISPIIGLLEHLYYLKKQSNFTIPIWLFFGCRSKDKDFLFEEDLSFYHSEGLITQLNVCFSREEECVAPSGEKRRRYVQDDIYQYKEKIFDWITNQEAIVYICGSAVTMFKDVSQTLLIIFQELGLKSQAEACAFLTFLTENKRFIKEIWA